MEPTEIAREIGKLMGADWREDWAPSAKRQWSLPPDLTNPSHLGVIEWWCRDRGVWISITSWELSGAITGYAVRKLQTCVVMQRDTYLDALLAAVRIAAEVEK